MKDEAHEKLRRSSCHQIKIRRSNLRSDDSGQSPSNETFRGSFLMQMACKSCVGELEAGSRHKDRVIRLLLPLMPHQDFLVLKKSRTDAF